MELAQVDPLQRMPVFGGLREALLRLLLERARPVQREAGEAFFVEGDVEQFALMQMNLGRARCRRLRATDERLFRAAMGEALAAPPRLALR